MKTAAPWRAASASDPGLRRTINEDRVFLDEELGVFLVADDLGGHAAGEHAAEIAVKEIASRLTQRPSNGIENEIRVAITAANNRIYQAAQSNPDWQGMACVLTLAIVRDERVTVGHVGDSRMYLFRGGSLHKITSDHSPVGELEERGELTEQQAMQHPRRNEVFRDVGAALHEPEDEQFIEIRTFAFPADGALLLCSDGLSDVLTSVEIAAILDGFNGETQRTVQQLIEAANHAGGPDNISVVLIAAPEFAGQESSAMSDSRARHAITRIRTPESGWPQWIKILLWLMIGIAVGVAIPLLLTWYAQQRAIPNNVSNAPRSLPQHTAVNSADALGIIKALSTAIPGDTVDVPPGQYLGPLVMKEGVNIESARPGQVVVRSDPKSANYPGIAIVASGIQDARVRGLLVTGDETHPLRVGMLIQNSAVEADELDVSGAIEAGILIEGGSHPLLLANLLHGNSGPGAVVRDQSSPRLDGNFITGNGLSPDAPRPGMEVSAAAQPELLNNTISDNGTDRKGGRRVNSSKGFKPEGAARPHQ